MYNIDIYNLYMSKKTKYALLGLLNLSPMSGYAIKKMVDAGLAHFWNENYGQIYPALNSMVSEGLAEKSADQGRGKRKRYIYSITDKGQAEFRDWLTQSSSPIIVRNELQLKFFLSGKMPSEISLDIIEKYKDQQDEMLEDYLESEIVLRQSVNNGEYPEELEGVFSTNRNIESSKQIIKQCNVFLLTLRHGIIATEGRIQWCNEVINYLNQERKSHD